MLRTGGGTSYPPTVLMPSGVKHARPEVLEMLREIMEPLPQRAVGQRET
jgi:hypothetical protein